MHTRALLEWINDDGEGDKLWMVCAGLYTLTDCNFFYKRTYHISAEYVQNDKAFITKNPLEFWTYAGVWFRMDSGARR
jgi:hypothetical protein